MHATTNFILNVVKAERENKSPSNNSSMPRNLSARIARICSLTDVSKMGDEQ